MSILGNSSNVAIDNAEMSNAGRGVKKTTQHANSAAFASSSDQVIVMEQPNVLNAGGNITYITWNFQLLEMVAAALSLAFYPFRTRVNSAERQSLKETESSTTGWDHTTLHDEEKMISGLAELEVGVEMFPSYGEGARCPSIRKVGPVLSKAYIENMLQLGIGYPMWNPQPHSDLPLGYRRSGISFGDLGIITDDGDFDFLFNVLLRSKDPVNVSAELPDDFDTPQRPKVMPRLRRSHNNGSYISNLKNVKANLDQHSNDLSFLCTYSASGAILSLPHGASENDLRNDRHWTQFISKNALAWYKYARENCGRDLDRHSLYLITGHMKSKTWGLATFNAPLSERSDVLVMGKLSAPKSPPYTWTKFEGATTYRSGPTPDREVIYEDSDDDIENQCLFLRGFKISLSEQAWNELCDVTVIDITNTDSQSSEEHRRSSSDGNAKGKREDETRSYSSSNGNLGNSVKISNFPTRSTGFHPSNKINEMLLSMVPHGHIAITHDNVWMDVVQSKDYENEEMLAATFGSLFVVSHHEDTGTCTFEPIKELIPVLKRAKEDSTYLDILTDMGNLAAVYKKQCKWAQAEKLESQVLEMCTSILGKEHPDTLASMNNLAYTYYRQGKLADAENLQDQVLDVRILEKDGVISMNNLAATYYKEGKFAEAETIHAQVLDVRTRILGKEHPDTVVSMNHLAATYYQQCKWVQAERLESQVLEICTCKLGKEHPDTLTSMSNLAHTYYEQGKLTEAESMQNQVLDVRIRNLGKEHPDTLTSMCNLASTYYKQGRMADVEIIYIQVLDMRTRILGEEHPDTVMILHHLAATYYQQGKWAEAETIHAQVLDMRIRILGREHPDTVSTMNHLAATYFQQDKLAEAETIHIQVLEVRTRILGTDHPDTLVSMNHLAATYYQQGKWAEAVSLESQVLEMHTSMLGKEHPDTLTNKSNLAAAYYEQGNLADAETIHTHVLDMRTRILGEKHPDTLASVNHLTQLYNERSKMEEAVVKRTLRR